MAGLFGSPEIQRLAENDPGEYYKQTPFMRSLWESRLLTWLGQAYKQDVKPAIDAASAPTMEQVLMAPYNLASGAVKGAIDTIDSAQKDPSNPRKMLELALMTGTGGGFFRGAPRGSLGMNVWHGGPNKWAPEPGFPQGRPRLDMIGTGEGNQAYGHGFYSAQSKNVGKQYRDALSAQKNMNIPNTRQIGAAISKQEQSALKESNATFRSSLKSAGIPVDHISSLRPWRTYHDYYNFKNELRDLDDLHMKQRGESVEAKIAEFERKYAEDPEFKDNFHNVVGPDAAPDWSHLRTPYSNAYTNASGRWNDAAGGTLYKLDLPDEDVAKYLDWDAPLSEQSKAVQDIAAQYGVKTTPSGMKEARGSDIYRAISSMKAKPPFNSASLNPGSVEGSEALRKAGIPGLKYFDGMSRGDAGGTRNYVTWDQDVLDRTKMLERNGDELSMGGGPLPAAAALQKQYEDEQLLKFLETGA